MIGAFRTAAVLLTAASLTAFSAAQQGDPFAFDEVTTPAGISGFGPSFGPGAWGDVNGDGVPDSCQDAFTGLPDCDGNGVPDACEDPRLDCDGNGVLDACEIADGSAEDCNGDEVIDACQFGGHPGYQVDRDYVSDLVGFTTGNSMWWAVQYEVGPGGSVIEWADVSSDEDDEAEAALPQID